MAIADDVLEDEASIGLELANEARVRGERQHDDRYLVPEDDLEVGGKALVALVRDEIDAPWGVAHGCRDPGEIPVERLGAARIERRHRADDRSEEHTSELQ